MKWLALAASILLSVESDASTYNCHHDKNSALLCFVSNHATSSKSRQVANSPTMNKNSFANFGSERKVETYFNRNPRQDTSLSMGIRSIFGLGKKTKEDDEKDRSQPPQDVKAALEAIKADLEAITKEEQSLVKDASDKDTQGNNMKPPPVEKKAGILNPLGRARQERSEPAPTSATTYGESVRDRIDRVKRGQMTEEEKAAFLRNALTRTPQGPKGPRIRQEIPSASGVTRNASSSASPARKDALWNTVIGNKSSSSSSRSSYGGYKSVNLSGRDDSAKREYLDMVTNPDRFKSYAAMGGYKSSSTGNSEAIPNDVLENSNTVYSEAPIDSQGQGLASRLESAAIMKEKFDAEARIRKEEEEQAYRAKVLEEQQRRDEEIRTREEQKIAAKRAEKERQQREQEERREAEKKRLADLQAAQDAYWTKKLEEERKRTGNSMSAEEKAMMEEKRRQEAAARIAASARQAAKQAEIEKLREEERARENPHEGEILKEAAEDELHERERNADIMEKSAAFVSRTVPQQRPNDVSSDAFLKEQEKKKAALDDFLKQQNERLASLSSPLPFLGKKTSKFESKSPSKSEGVIPSLNLTDLTRRNNGNDSQGTNSDMNLESKTSRSTNDTSRLSLADLTMAKRSENGSTPQESTTDEPQIKIPSLAEMTMLKKTQNDGVPPSTPTRRPAPANPSSSSRPIRQSIPMSNDDDEDDDFFTYSRNGGNSGMSIKEIMSRQSGNSSDSSSTSKSDAAKQQSKMWGIDIDKFMD
mmetsp:Transcript_4368/g.8397  ORF Transcript_4368/g.8397 Transcript_4368/m.8397 type:complete len:761 (+) Transcript_4368:76-2358(+)|eukprot:CAMPEP_0176487102 /NCGR_PEP_ID=MMETSP0200_2-20121128/5936_1 /TAXON_ID=947934 /ORGANISM="Chaetoceros sp., Strain GSL56" /LENGTH=760 /DNA_ID=CAMNT_0017883875 /DNA_START=11 /DNA_END=2293 /DNA_ORIENTATION=+